MADVRAKASPVCGRPRRAAFLPRTPALPKCPTLRGWTRGVLTWEDVWPQSL